MLLLLLLLLFEFLLADLKVLLKNRLKVVFSPSVSSAASFWASLP